MRDRKVPNISLVPDSKCSAPCHWQWMWAARWQHPPHSRSPAHYCYVLAQGSCFHQHTPCSNCCVWCWIAKKKEKKTDFISVQPQIREKACISCNLNLNYAAQATSSCCNGRGAQWADSVILSKTPLTAVDVWIRSDSSLNFTPNGDRPTSWNRIRNWPAPSLQKLKPNWTFFWGSKKFNYLINIQICNFYAIVWFYFLCNYGFRDEKCSFSNTIQALRQILHAPSPSVIQHS